MLSEATFLYVEDDALSRDVMRLIVETAMGIKTLTIFDDSRDFITRARSLPAIPDVILLDIQVRPHDGFEMLSMLRQDPELKKARVIALTASVMNEEIEQMRACGFDGTIGKPVSVTTFPELLARVAHGEAIWNVG